MSSPVYKRGNLWGFWNEVWTDTSYGYNSEQDAQLALLGYSEMEVEGDIKHPEATRFWAVHGLPFRRYEEVKLTKARVVELLETAFCHHVELHCGDHNTDNDIESARQICLYALDHLEKNPPPENTVASKSAVARGHDNAGADIRAARKPGKITTS